MKWYFKCFRQYVDFSGRARRKEYWMFSLLNFVFAFVLGIIDVSLGWTSSEIGIGVLGGFYSLAALVPGLAVCVRRLHDIGKSGWNLFLALIPLVGAFVLIVWYCQEGEFSSNAWGANPKNE